MLLWLICNLSQDDENTYNREPLAVSYHSWVKVEGFHLKSLLQRLLSQIATCRTQSSVYLQVMTKDNQASGKQVHSVK